MNIKFLLQLISCCCCCSCPRGQLSKEEKRLLPPSGSGVRRGTKRGRPLPGAAGRLCRRNGGAPVEWRPSLSPVLEDNVLPVRNEHAETSLKVTSTKARNLRRKISSFSRPPSRLSFDDLLGFTDAIKKYLNAMISVKFGFVVLCVMQYDRTIVDYRRSSNHMAMPTFSPAPFMF